MKKEEFIDLLRFYLHKLPNSVINDILSDYQEHFQIAMNQGKSEEEICQELGSPKQIAKEYLDNERRGPGTTHRLSGPGFYHFCGRYHPASQPS